MYTLWEIAIIEGIVHSQWKNQQFYDILMVLLHPLGWPKFPFTFVILWTVAMIFLCSNKSHVGLKQHKSDF